MKLLSLLLTLALLATANLISAQLRQTGALPAFKSPPPLTNPEEAPIQVNCRLGTPRPRLI